MVLRDADWVVAMRLRCNRGAAMADDAARRAAAPAKQQTISVSRAPAVPARTCAAWVTPGRPVGTTPPMTPSAIKPMVTLINAISFCTIWQFKCQGNLLERLALMSSKSHRLHWC